VSRSERWVPIIVATVFVAFIGGFILLMQWAGDQPTYEERIEAKYPAKIVSVIESGFDAADPVIYRDHDGKVCTAAKLPGDELAFMGCEEAR
jgi:hypothetical protein